MIEMSKKYRTRDGRPVRVLCVDRKSEQPVAALVMIENDLECIAAFDADGKYVHCGTIPHEFDLIEVSPYEDYRIDEPVMVRNHPSDAWRPRYFAGVNAEGFARAWNEGGTSWSTQMANTWKFCRRPTEGEVKHG